MEWFESRFGKEAALEISEKVETFFAAVKVPKANPES